MSDRASGRDRILVNGDVRGPERFSICACDCVCACARVCALVRVMIDYSDS